MKTKSILIVISLCFSLAGCLSSSPDVDAVYTKRPEVVFDSVVALTSVDNFRIQMTSRMAQMIATEKGYKLDTRYSSLTIEDLIEQSMMQKRARGEIYLERFDEPTRISYRLSINFDFGKIIGITLEHVFYGSDRVHARPLFERYKEKLNNVSLIKKDEKFELYGFEPNPLSRINLSFLDTEYSLISFSVRDWNYSLNEEMKSYSIR